MYLHMLVQVDMYFPGVLIMKRNHEYPIFIRSRAGQKFSTRNQMEEGTQHRETSNNTCINSQLEKYCEIHFSLKCDICSMSKITHCFNICLNL
jgi:hypothetical protein